MSAVSPNAPAPGPDSSSLSSSASAGRSQRGGGRASSLPWAVTGALVVGILIFAAVLLSRTPPVLSPPAKRLTGVATMLVTPRQHCEALELPARLEADRSAVLSSELPGRLQAWRVGEGDAVQAGQELAQLNRDDLNAELGLMEARRATAERTVAVAEESLAMARVALTQAQKTAASLTLERDSARADLDLATKEFERVQTLAAAVIATPSDLDRAENTHTLAQLAVAKADDAIARAAVAVEAAGTAVAQADATLALNRSQVQEIDRQLDGLNVTLAKTSIVAPFAGRFEEHLVEAGEVVAVGQPLGRLYDLAWLRAAVDVPDRYAPLLDSTSTLVQKYIDLAMPGAVQDLKASVTIPGLPQLMGGTYAGVELPATIHRVAQAASPTSNTFRVELRLANPGGALKEGIIAKARLSFLRYEQAITVPVKAVQVTEVGPRVLVVESIDGRSIARVRSIEPVSIRDDEMLVRGGLKGGEHLVISGAKGIVDGEEVLVVVADGKVVANRATGRPAAIPVDALTTAPAKPGQAAP